MNKIILVTTKGCEGCSIMRESINQAIVNCKKDIVFVEKDHKDVDKKIFDIHLKDFPTTILMKNGRVTRKEVGTRPWIVVLRWIDIDFK